ncbi:redox-sensing transcriptional repressor [Frankineae bacterium MT45]|nr:redox-sensing transcriptional repressor [Frankineae bacterium MT45]
MTIRRENLRSTRMHVGEGELPEAVTADSESAPEDRAIPEATVARLATYLRVLDSFEERGVTTLSSDELASATGVNSAMLRKDLSFLGSFGIRGVGYDVETLTELISRTLGITVHRAVALIGIGNLGQALAGYAGFATRGFRIAALLDAAPTRIGSQIGGLTVQDVAFLEQIVLTHHIDIAVLAIPAPAAQELCDRLVACGVSSILNFAPTVLSVPPDVDVRKVDLAAELQILSFHENQKEHRHLAMSARKQTPQREASR